MIINHLQNTIFTIQNYSVLLHDFRTILHQNNSHQIKTFGGRRQNKEINLVENGILA
ncbi:hypothetical protein HMPREF0653_01675 [Prevotella disiens JCM 6334 = ATCC 29426]|uniref:Uncharacterized protein n=1 Tax=Prevotella disiens JCM 6334 = ATCC 29426 TaxID=1235811 RepID=A0ABP2Y9M6_9BACT|nr:hypothetical protein HMPREF0653_01675 [Prevotella disiens JCM 6334 = ATCC 29426]